MMFLIQTNNSLGKYSKLSSMEWFFNTIYASKLKRVTEETGKYETKVPYLLLPER
jgi:hypothetical protein